MHDQAPRIAMGLVLLVALWIGVYWWWPAGSESRISVAPPDSKNAATKAPPAKPRPAPVNPPSGAQTPAPNTSTPPPQPPPAPPSPPPEKSRPVAVIPPEFREHTIKTGETYSTLSLKYFGTSAYASAIAKSNPLLSPSNLKPGRVVRIPKDPKNIQGIPVKADDPAQPRAPSTEYVVEAGDTLSRISQTVYGESKHAKLIYEANRDVMRDEDSLKVGQKLRIPPKPKE